MRKNQKLFTVEMGTGDGFRYDKVGAAVCLFLEFCEDETQAIAHGYAPLNYTRKETEGADNATA